MEVDFTERWAQSTVAELKALGVEFASGLDDSEITEIGRELNVVVPEELVLFLRVGIPVSPNWPNWLDGPEVVLAAARSWIDKAFSFDVRNGEYWHPLFGGRPADTEAAVERALEVVASAPPLIPIYGHRFLSSAPLLGPRAVLSVYQANDSVVYGNDLAAYFALEFDLRQPSWATREQPEVPVWQDLFDF